jgi:nicotinamide riboside transporter PnuC
MMDNWEESWRKYADRVMERLGWIGAFFVVFGYYLNAQYYLCCWPVWILGNTLVAGYSVHKKAYSTALMSLIITIMNVYGYITWKNL